MTDDDDEGVVVFRNGRRNNPRLNDMRRQKIDDFMLVSRHVDIWRNEECKKCKETNLRFDATRLHFRVPQWCGGRTHDGTIDGCVGCYLYDPVRFRSEDTKPAAERIALAVAAALRKIRRGGAPPERS